jgi:hypothetical protein
MSNQDGGDLSRNSPASTNRNVSGQSVTIENDTSVEQVSLQTYQAIYRSITGKNDSIKKYFRNDIQIGFDELK